MKKIIMNFKKALLTLLTAALVVTNTPLNSIMTTTVSAASGISSSNVLDAINDLIDVDVSSYMSGGGTKWVGNKPYDASINDLEVLIHGDPSGLDCLRATIAVAGRAAEKAGYSYTDFVTNASFATFSKSPYYTTSDSADNVPVGTVLLWGTDEYKTHAAIVIGYDEDGTQYNFSAGYYGSTNGCMVQAYRDENSSIEGQSGKFWKAYIPPTVPDTKTISYSVSKSSILPDVTNGNGMYNFSGMTFGVYSDESCTDQIDTLVTDANGNASGSKEVDPSFNDVYIKELNANTNATNYLQTDTSVKHVDVSGGSGTAYFSNTPINDPAMIGLTKVDKEGKVYAAPMGEAQFTINYYDTLGDISGRNPFRTWIIKTVWNEELQNYIARLDEEHKVSGNYFYDEGNRTIIPLGTITIEETTPADNYTVDGGYLLNNSTKEVISSTEKMTIKIVNENSMPVIYAGNLTLDPDLLKEEIPIRGGYTLQKTDLEVLLDTTQDGVNGVRSQGDASFAGAEFDLYYLGNGDGVSSMKFDTDGDGLGDGTEYQPSETTPIEHITLDEKGYYSTPNNTYLAYGKYRLIETKAPVGYSLTDPNTGKALQIEFDLTEDEKVYTLTAPEKVYSGDIQITKTRNSNGTSGFTTPESGATFDIVLKRYVQQVADANGHSEITKQDVIDAYEQRESFATKDLSTHSFNNATQMEYDQITTGDDGVAKSKKLAYGTYCVVQVDGNKETHQIETVFEFSISQENQPTQYFSATNNDKGYIVKLFKKDSDTGELVTYTSSAWKIRKLTDVNGKDVSNQTDQDTSMAVRLVNGYVTQTVGDGDNKTVYDVFMTASQQVAGDTEGLETGVFYGASNGNNKNQNATVTVPLELLAGTYQLEEVITSEGFVTNKPIVFTINADEITRVNDTAQNIIEVTFENTPLYGDVAFKKVINKWNEADTTLLDYDLTKFGFTLVAAEDIINPDDGSVLVTAGSKAVAYTHDPSNPFVTVGETFCDKEGNLSFKNIPLGKYILTETTQPDGYVTNNHEYNVNIEQSMFDKYIDTKKTLLGKVIDRSVVQGDVQVTVDGTLQEEGQYEIVNETIKNSFSKKQVTGADELVGAELSIKDAEGNVIVKWTSGKTEYKVEGLTANKTYYLTEDLAPLSYAKATTIEFVVSDDKEVHGHTMIDKYVETSKLDIAGEEVIGAKMSVTDEDGNKVDSWYSDGTVHKINNLEEGKSYVLHEEVAADGYVKATDIPFEVTGADENGIKVNQTVNMVDKKVTINKTDGNGNEIVGAKITILDEDGNKVDEWTSTDKPYEVDGLEEGKKYTWHEEYSTAIFGYYYAEDYTFEVTGADEDGIKVDQNLEMVDAPIKYLIAKVDDTGKYVKGVTLTLTDITDEENPSKVALPNNGVTTDEPFELNGKLQAEHTYELVETEYVAGVYKATKLEFTVPKYGTDAVTTVTMEDIETNVAVSKVDNHGQRVKGAKMSILPAMVDVNGNVKPWHDDQTGEDAKPIYTFVTTDKPTDISDYVKGSNEESGDVWYILREDESLKDLLNDRYLDGKLSAGSYPRDKFTIPEVEHRKWLKLDYKRNYSLVNIILFFFTFAMIGWLWEVMLHLFSTGNFVNRGTLMGPWLPIYGYGGVLILILLKPFRERPYLLFILTCLLCGIIEYLTSWYLEVTYNLRWWDYTGYFININGRVCLEGLLVFGLGGCGFTYLVAPFLDNLYNKIKPSIKYLVAGVLLFFFILDNIYCHNNPNMGEGITSYKNDCNLELKIL